MVINYTILNCSISHFYRHAVSKGGKGYMLKIGMLPKRETCVARKNYYSTKAEQCKEASRQAYHNNPDGKKDA